MKTQIVRDLMIPIDEYATVPKGAKLYDAIVALEKTQQDFIKNRYPHRAILVYEGEKSNIIGKVSQLDILRALEPKYDDLLSPGKSQTLLRFGFSYHFQKSLVDQYHLFEDAFHDICLKASQKKVEDFMYAPDEGEYVNVDATLSQAVHQLVIGHHQSLLVTEDKKKIVGVLRLTDVFMVVFDEIMVCQLP